MPVYEYEAVGEDGATLKGLVEADSPRGAREQVRRRNVHVQSLKEVARRKEGLFKRLSEGSRGSRVDEIASFTRHFVILLQNGATIERALGVMSAQTENPRFEAVLRDLRQSIVGGDTLSGAMRRHRDYFSEFYMNMVAAGEASGTLPAVLGRLATSIKRQHEVRERVRAALIYPVILITAVVAVVAFLTTTVVPKIVGVIENMGVELPLSTRLVIGVSDVVRGYWPVLLVLLVALVLALKAARRSVRGRLFFDRLVLRLPLAGRLAMSSLVSRFASTMSGLLTSGIPMTDSLLIAQAVMANAHVGMVIDRMRDAIIRGVDVSSALGNERFFPATIPYLISIGEESGRLPEVFANIAESYEEEVSLGTARMLALLEPLIVLTMAVVVGFIVLAILQPVLSISQGIAR